MRSAGTSIVRGDERSDGLSVDADAEPCREHEQLEEQTPKLALPIA